MRIAFLCSSGESGKDGVGDYTRVLAEECSRNGHECSILALADSHIAEPAEIAAGGESRTVSILRLPTAMPWNSRIRLAEEYLARFEPDWLSLQFVPYGFHPRGFIYEMTQRIGSLTAGCKLQIMFHEIWIAPHKGAGIKERIIGGVQKFLVRRMVRKLKPDVVHTSNVAYQMLLVRNGIKAELLPLFGQIPIHDGSNQGRLMQEMKAAGISIDEINRQKFWLFGIFGSLHPVWPPEPLFSRLRDAAECSGRRIVIVSIGRMGGGEALWESLSQRYSQWFDFVRLGERSVEQVSDFFHWIDFGIATTPWAIIGKSGTVAAMLDHGLPVIVNRDETRFSFDLPEIAVSPLLVKMGPDLASKLPALKKLPPKSSVPDIVGTFLSSLQSGQ